MATPNKSGLLISFFLVGVFLLPLISSCGKGANANASGLNTQLQIVDLSPDAQPLNLYLNSIKESTNIYSYPNNSGYFFISTLIPPIQLRTATVNAITVLRIDSVLKPNSKYTLFVTGYRADSSIKNSVLSLDTATLPDKGRAKIRFAHTSPSSPNLDLRANDTTNSVLMNVKFNTVTKYVQVPVGNYNFTISNHATPTKIETSILNFTVQDGRAYTIYTQGIVGRTDSVAFGANVLTNNLLLKNTQQ
ncbi:DUF4397 domain-containing protein [Mucilaginibacter aquaedulcis]|uniref:DUF4397 domain-containing protein n=1 Tax=Mucilaginibacter aquaedulcis TaxID=1187081 RepID=UPI0025B4D5A4|nr:DUF4397 domain-containing protein [Mucilaginibacter aquaedulcis]MDN3549801.1 DUF4397 domain-containing protein [Mucilaginibacter aquaedulcis]